MTTKEAIAILERLQEPEVWEPQISEDAYTALQMAIDALGADTNFGSKGDMIYRQDAIRVVSGLDSSFVNYIEELPSAKPEPLTEAEIIICKLYLDDLDKYKTCNEYKLLMGLLDGTASVQPEPCEDCVSRTSVIRLLHSGYHSRSMIEEVKELPPVQPEPIRINLNEPIKVKLTDWGKEIYYHQYDRTNQIVGRKVCKPMFPKEDENGYTEFQLWYFIELYGEHMGITLPNVIEPLEIIYKR